MRLTTILVLILIPVYFKSQEIITSVNEIYPDKEFENIHVKKISSDSSSSTFAIWIKQKVKLLTCLSYGKRINRRGIWRISNKRFYL